MRLSRFASFIDLAIAMVVLVAIILPAREMYASSVLKPSAPAADQFALSLAEARTLAHPDDGAAVDDFARRLGSAGFKDWAIEVALHGSARASKSPSQWHALLATSVAYVDKLDVVPALDYANRALAACKATSAACPSWEQVRIELYQQHLDAGVKSGIDPRKGPAAIKAFRRAGESALRQVYVGGHAGDRPSSAPASGSGSAGGSAGNTKQ
jgi:hypothetical protein